MTAVAQKRAVSTVEGDVPVRDMSGWRYLNALSDSILVVDQDRNIRFANLAAEQLLRSSRQMICRRRLSHYFPEDGPIFWLARQAHESGNTVAENDAALDLRQHGVAHVAIHASPVASLFPDADEDSGDVLISIREQAIARQIDRQLNHRSAARSVTAMASMMAHEVRNPLSGIKGAAQLLEGSVAANDRSLTQLICDEVDRLNALVDRIEVFSDRPAVQKGAVNIHEVLGRVRSSAENGFARSVRLIEDYDPSLPPVSGDKDQLIQVFMNLVKNAAEAVRAGVAQNGQSEIHIRTAYRSGVRIASPSSEGFVRLPIVVSVEDNGPGIPDDLRDHLFDPFVTTKASGSGLGLALVAKIIEEQGGVVEFGEENGRTAFKVLLAAHEESGSLND